MYGLKRNNILIMAFMFYGASLAAQNHQDVQDSVRIYFKQGKIYLVPTLRENQSALVSGSAFIHCRLLIYSYLCTIILKSNKL